MNPAATKATPVSASPAVFIWRRLQGEGHDVCRFLQDDQGCTLSGMAVFRLQGRSCQLRYDVQADAAFRTRRGTVSGFIGAAAVDLRIRALRNGRWTLNGVPQPSLTGCLDLDLNFTPATNLLPLRRLALRVGQSADAPAAWLKFPSLALQVLPQRYARHSRTEFDYEAPTVGYRGRLRVQRHGAVTHYPALFEWAGAA